MPLHGSLKPQHRGGGAFGALRQFHQTALDSLTDSRGKLRGEFQGVGHLGQAGDIKAAPKRLATDQSNQFVEPSHRWI